MRSVSNGILGSQGLAGYLKSPISNQDNLLSLMNKEAAKKQNPQFKPMINPQTSAININSDKGIYDPKTGTWSSSGDQSVALKNLQDRQDYNQTINNALAKQGIKLSSKEKMTLTIDKDGQITVSGINDQSKKAKIEGALNSALKDSSTGLMMHIESIKAMNGKQTPGVLDKWMVYDFLKDQTGQGLGELKLVNGKVVGANEKLQKIIDGQQDFGANTEYVHEVMTKLKSVLAIGVSKIPDLKQSIDFQNGSLIDKDVENGFGPNQLKTWFADFITGKAKWDVQA